LKTIINTDQLNIVLQRLALEYLENIDQPQDSAIIGIQPRGGKFSDQIVQYIHQLKPDFDIHYGKLDITFYRDDVHNYGSIPMPSQTEINFNVQDKNVLLIDDVLHTGRTVRAAMDALLSFGRPKKVELMVLIDRRFNREVPVQPDYVGLAVDTLFSQRVNVIWKNKNSESIVQLIDSH